MEGYDRRVVRTPTRGRTQRLAVNSTGMAHTKQDTVVSYRDNIRGELVDPTDIDPYAWFLDRTSARKRRQAVLDGSYGREKPAVVDEGHPYWVEKRQVYTTHFSSSHRLYTGSSSTPTYGGPLWATSCRLSSTAALGLLFPLQNGTELPRRTFGAVIPRPPTDELVSFGKKAIANLAPGQPDVNFLQMLGELYQGLPSVPFGAMSKWEGIAKRGSNEFLNYVFGVAPTIGDIAKVCSALMNISQRFAQLQRDAGAGVRRRWELPVEKVEQTFGPSDMQLQGQILMGTAPDNFGLASSQAVSAKQYGGSYQSTLRLQERRSLLFTGSFTYWLPMPSGWEGRWERFYDMFDRTISMRPSSEVIWNLTPFSWLVDWFLDISTSLRAMDIADQDRLVINYGYVSRHLYREVKHTCRLTNGSGARKPSFDSVTTTASLNLRERIRANPYGFTVGNSAEWTPLRFAILAAIGISRNPRL